MKYIALCAVLIFLMPVDITKDELLGRFDPATHPDFVRISSKYTNKSNIYLRKEAYAAFEKMHLEASKVGIALTIVSATRNFDYQKGIWERKWSRTRYMGWPATEKVIDIMTYSSMPGTSRHHWGTDIDLNALDNSYFEKGEGLTAYQWLSANGPAFGFQQTYTSKETGRTGYEEEKWHWSYMPLAEKYLEAYRDMITNEDITGFHGAEYVDTLNIITNYVQGISTLSISD